MNAAQLTAVVGPVFLTHTTKSEPMKIVNDAKIIMVSVAGINFDYSEHDVFR